MAIIRIENAEIVGKNNGKGFRVIDEKEYGGKTYQQRFTVWADNTTLNVGDRVTVEGNLGAKIGQWTDREGHERTSLELSVNNPIVKTLQPAEVSYSYVPTSDDTPF